MCSSLKEWFEKIGEISHICDSDSSAGVPTYHLGKLRAEPMMSGLDLDSQAEVPSRGDSGCCTVWDTHADPRTLPGCLRTFTLLPLCLPHHFHIFAD